MQGVALVPDGRREIIWLDADFAINLGAFDDATLNEVRTLPSGTSIAQPVAVASDANTVHVFGVSPEYALTHWRYDANAAFSIRWSEPEVVGGDVCSAPAVVAGSGGLDVFCLGADRGMLHTRWHGTAWSAWVELGGCFTSLPIALPHPGGGFDLFARGLDFVVYHTHWTTGAADWQKLGGGLLGEPEAASAPAAVRVSSGMVVFVTTPGGAIACTEFDGTVWKPWSSLDVAQRASGDKDAITFISEPVAVVVPGGIEAGGGTPPVATTGEATRPTPPLPAPLLTGRTRVDVFGVGSDKQLWHKALSAGGWDPPWTWTSVGGSFACAPSVVVHPGHGVTAVTATPARFNVAVPHTDGTVHRFTFDPSSSPPVSDDQAPSRPPFRLPSRFAFAVPKLQIDNTRSQGQDTDLGVVTLTAGNWPLQTVSFAIGDVDNGSHDLSDRLGLDAVVELPEPVVFTYSIVNSHDTDTDAEKTLETQIAKGVDDFINDAIKGAIEGEAKSTIVGSLLGTALVGWLTDWLNSELAFAFGGCDGLVAAEAITYPSGRAVATQIAEHGSGTPRIWETSTRNLREDYPTNCQSSSYLIFTSITPL
jgi:hypothetical protein